MSLYGGQIPGGTLRAAFRALIAGIDAGRLLAAMRMGELRPRGFRIEAGNEPRLREWLLQRVFARPVLPAAALRLLEASAEPARRMVALLDESVLRDHLAALAAALDAPQLTAALEVDPREGVRALAAALTDSTRPPLTDAAPHAVAELLAPLAALLPPAAPAPSGVATARPPGEASTRPDSNAPAHAARRLHALEKRLLAQKEALATLKTRLSEHETDKARSSVEAKQLAAARDSLQSELETLRAERQSSIDEQVNLRLRDRAHAWMAPLERTAEAAADRAPGEALLERARKALNRQQARDRHSANRTILRQRRAALNQAWEAVREAYREALHPLPELPEIEQALRGAVADLDRLLGEPAPPTAPVPERLAGRINAAGPDALGAWIELAETLRDHELLDEGAFVPVAFAIARRRGLLAAEAPPDALPKDADPEDPGVQLQAALLGRIALELLIDGHNTLFALRARYGTCFDNDQPGQRARTRLAADLAELNRSHPDLRIRLVFDGPERSDRQAQPNLTVTYSGGTGTDRADRVLIEEAGFLAGRAGRRIVVVSNDNQVIFRTRGLGAGVMSPAELERFL